MTCCPRTGPATMKVQLPSMGRRGTLGEEQPTYPRADRTQAARGGSKLAARTTLPQVARELGISEATTFHRWRKRYDGAQENAIHRLRELEKQNRRLKNTELVTERAIEGRLSDESSVDYPRDVTLACKRDSFWHPRSRLSCYPRYLIPQSVCAIGAAILAK